MILSLSPSLESVEVSCASAFDGLEFRFGFLTWLLSPLDPHNASCVGHSCGGLFDELIANAERLGTPRKFILEADNLTGTPGAFQRLIKLFSNTPGAHQWLNGVVVDEETLYQKTDQGELVVDVLKKKEGGVLVGIRVQMGSVELPDGLDERCQKYYKAGARFVELDIDQLEIDPSEQSDELVIEKYANCLARSATIFQENGLVPIVGPEILVNGSDDDISYKVSDVFERLLVESYKAFNDHPVLLGATLLNPKVVADRGLEALKVAPQVIAEDTLRVLNRTVPAGVSAIIFSHGALGEEEPTFFDAITSHNTRKQWPISSIVTLNPNRLMDFAGEEGKMEIAAFIQYCKAKTKAPVVMSDGQVGAIVMSEGVATFEMPGGGGDAVTGATAVMPEGLDDTFGMPGGGANFKMPEGVDDTFGMPGGGGPVPGTSHNLRPAEYVYEFKFGFIVHFFFSASAH